MKPKIPQVLDGNFVIYASESIAVTATPKGNYNAYFRSDRDTWIIEDETFKTVAAAKAAALKTRKVHLSKGGAK